LSREENCFRLSAYQYIIGDEFAKGELMVSDYTKFIWLSNNVDEKIRRKTKGFFLNSLTELFDWVIEQYY